MTFHSKSHGNLFLQSPQLPPGPGQRQRVCVFVLDFCLNKERKKHWQVKAGTNNPWPVTAEGSVSNLSAEGKGRKRKSSLDLYMCDWMCAPLGKRGWSILMASYSPAPVSTRTMNNQGWVLVIKESLSPPTNLLNLQQSVASVAMSTEELNTPCSPFDLCSCWHCMISGERKMSVLFFIFNSCGHKCHRRRPVVTRKHQTDQTLRLCRSATCQAHLHD